MTLKTELGSQLRRTPAERDPPAAMAVIVHEVLLAKRFGANDEALAPVGAKSRHRPNDPTLVGDHRRERRAVVEAPSTDRRAAA
jgi:hypothetical protein